MSHETIAFPMVALVEGGLTTDGEQVLLQLMTVEDGPINFGLRLADMESFVTFLLQMAASAKQAGPSEERVCYQPIPIPASAPARSPTAWAVSASPSAAPS